MMLEGRLKDLGLVEVMQLLAIGRKTGTLVLEDAVLGRRAEVRVIHGVIVDGLDNGPANALAQLGVEERVRETVLDLFFWADGSFRFVPADVTDIAGVAQIGADTLLMESVRRLDGWAELADRIPHPRVVPCFPDTQPQQLSLLHLQPTDWEILTQVDGTQDVRGIAQALRRDLVDVAGSVHSLVGLGVLVVREAVVVTRVMTPPDAIDRIEGTDSEEDDTLFDPWQMGSDAAEGLATYAVAHAPFGQSVTPSAFASFPTVASTDARPSLRTSVSVTPSLPGESAQLLQNADAAARRGELRLAVTHWSRWLQLSAGAHEEARVREQIALAERLDALLHSAQRD